MLYNKVMEGKEHMSLLMNFIDNKITNDMVNNYLDGISCKNNKLIMYSILFEKGFIKCGFKSCPDYELKNAFVRKYCEDIDIDYQEELTRFNDRLAYVLQNN